MNSVDDWIVYNRIRSRLVVLAFLVGVLVLLLASGWASASSVSPVAPPKQGSTTCPSIPLLPGQTGQNASLIAFLQPGATDGSTCGLFNGGTLVGDTIIVTLYTPNGVAGGAVPIGVEEFQWGTETVSQPGPNNTTVERQVQVETDDVWSNTSISAGPLEVQQFDLIVPDVQQQENLRVTILSVVLSVQVVTPGAGIAIPQNYPQLLLHDFGFEVAFAIFFVIGIGLATAIRLKARHVERIWPIGAAGIFSAFIFAGWFLSDYPLSAIPVGSAPEALVALPGFFVGTYTWLALFPTEAPTWKIRWPVADLKEGRRSYDEKRWREFEGPNGTEYIGEGGNGAWLRLLGRPTILDNRILTDMPYRIHFHGFRSVRWDTKGEYHAWSPQTGDRVLEVQKSKVIWLPWRKKASVQIEKHYKEELRGRVKPPSLVGLLVHVTESRAMLRANGKQGSILAEGWIEGTLEASRAGEAIEKIMRAYSHALASVKAHAIDWGHKLALTFRMAEEFPGSPVALKALEDLVTRQQAEIMSERTWFDFLQAQVAEDSARKPTRVVPAAPETILLEAANPSPPESPQRKVPPGARGEKTG